MLESLSPSSNSNFTELRPRYALGLDVGTNSLGWSVNEIDANGEVVGLLDFGARIFSDGTMPKSPGMTLQAERMQKRGAERARALFRARKEKILTACAKAELIRLNGAGPAIYIDRMNPFHPLSKTGWKKNAWMKRSVYKDRARAAMEPFDPQNMEDRAALARILLHLHGNRGVYLSEDGAVQIDVVDTSPEETEKKSKRKQRKESDPTASVGDREAAEFSAACDQRDRLVEAFADKGGLGIWLWEQLQNIKTNARGVRKRDGDGGAPGRTSRRAVQDEFERIRSLQQPVFDMSAAWWDDVARVLFERPPTQIAPWPCPYVRSEFRVPRTHWMAQKYLAWADAWNVRCYAADGTEVCIDHSARGLIADLLSSRGEVTWKNMIAALGLPDTVSFNRKTAAGKRASWRGHPFVDLGRWFEMMANGTPSQKALYETVYAQFSAPLRNKSRDLEVVPEDVRAMLRRPPRGSVPFGPTILAEILASISSMRPEDAVERAAQTCLQGNGTANAEYVRACLAKNELPYYGAALPRLAVPVQMRKLGSDKGPERRVTVLEREYGRIPNPTVHIALMQTKRVVDEIVKRYGRPARITVETTRDLRSSKAAKEKESKKIARNEKANREAKVYLASLGVSEDRGKAILRYHLWRELVPCSTSDDRLCPYCVSASISREDAIKGFDVEVEHIVPRSRGGTGERVNLTLACKDCNASKSGNVSPYEVWGDDKARWDRIVENARKLAAPWKKRNLIASVNPEKDAEAFLAGQIEATGWASKVLLQWLKLICLDQNQVIASRGSITAHLRRAWDLEKLKKDKVTGERLADHRHHAIDAFVTACVDSGLQQRISRENARENPWPAIRPVAAVEQAERRYELLTVSHKTDRPYVSLRRVKGGVVRATSVAGPLQGETIERFDTKRFSFNDEFLPKPKSQHATSLDDDSNAFLEVVLQRITASDRVDEPTRANLLGVFEDWFGDSPAFSTLRGRFTPLRCNGKRRSVGPALLSSSCQDPWGCGHGSADKACREIFRYLFKDHRLSAARVVQRSDRPHQVAVGPGTNRKTRKIGVVAATETICLLVNVDGSWRRRIRAWDLAHDFEDAIRDFTETSKCHRIYPGDYLLQGARLFRVKGITESGRIELSHPNLSSQDRHAIGFESFARSGYSVGSMSPVGVFQKKATFERMKI